MENKEQRLARQLKNWKKLVREMKEDIASMYARKVKRDAYFINYKNIVEQCI